MCSPLQLKCLQAMRQMSRAAQSASFGCMPAHAYSSCTEVALATPFQSASRLSQSLPELLLHP